MNPSIQTNQSVLQFSKTRSIRSLAALGFLMASYPVLSQPSFWGDWESGTVTGKGNVNWMSKQVVSSDRITLIKDSSRSGAYARVEVRSGDNPLSSSSGTERAEVLHMQDNSNYKINENLNSGTQQYSFSVKFDTSWQAISKSNGGWGIFLQLHGDDSYSTNPALALDATDKIRLNTRVGDLTKSKIVTYDLSNGNLNKGKWIDFILTVKFAADNKGFINLMRRDEGEADFKEVLDILNTPTLMYSSSVNNGKVLDHYWKHGLYRNKESFTSVLYLDGLTREAVDGSPSNPSTPSDSEAPSVPSGLSATASSSAKIDLAWNASTDNVSVAGYKIYRDGTEIGSSASTGFTDTSVKEGTTYSYTVKAYDESGNLSTSSSAATVKILQTINISSYYVTDITSKSASVKWTSNTSTSGTVNYGTNSSNLSSSANYSSLSTSHTVKLSGLSRKTTYYYQITARDRDGNKITSPVASFTTLRR